MRETIIEILNKITGDDESALSDVTNLVSGGYLDSFDTLYFILSLEDEFQVSFEFDDDALRHFESVDRIESLLRKKLSDSSG